MDDGGCGDDDENKRKLIIVGIFNLLWLVDIWMPEMIGRTRHASQYVMRIMEVYIYIYVII